MVAWPDKFKKVSKKIVKGSIDPKLVPTKTFVTRVLKFSGKCNENLVVTKWYQKCYSIIKCFEHS